ncbi:probable multidrug resistance-associated protein lethal(2)03659 [Anthonomus grandis grandis]|uniref:probable multidrug resistance-associated protein lethal(2)03659 n=1 Tax=Anthonomus grandis grandis TaxID=2921223 RepID=UPI002165499D|nr:probable multidrug resistance-associated protein lethal(2)03659 [Anthonomus grandis grandis]XP_050306974.1 probable multidrug resistance-associated protein lethal(2)03659 [Anthonomus grandis grandis]
MDSGQEENRRSNPRERANLFSFLTFAYTFGLFKRGLKGNLQEADIYAIPEDCDSKYCGDKTELEWKQNKTLIKLLWRRFGWRYSILTAFHLLWTMFNSIVHPHITSKFISYFQTNSKISRNDAYFYAGSVVALAIFHCFWAHNYFMLQCKLELQIKASLTSLIYRKVLKLRPGEISETSMGNIVTILTKDIKLVVHNIWTVSELIVGSIQTVTVFYLLYSKMGLPSTIAMGMLFTGLVVQVLLSKTITNMRLKVGKMADKRLQLTQEALSALRIIKMYTWEMFFNRRIYEARKKEMKTTMTSFYLKIVLILIGIVGSKITFPVLLISYVALGYSTNTELVFYVMGLFKELRHSVGIAIPLGLSRSAEFYASLSRVSRMLHIEEHYAPQATSAPEGKEKGKIEFKEVSVSVGKEQILKHLNLSITDAGLNIVTGLVGSGKSSFLKAILRDYRITRGSLIVNGSISYASQDPWLFPSSIKQNILFGLPLDQNRYNDVIKVCCLEYDFSLLPNGDETIVIDGGMNLSKGQQARVNLARAIYKDSDIYLLDDSLAALDVKVQEDIFQKCIRQYLKRKLVIFVSQNPEYFKSAGTVIFLDRGTVKSVSKPAEIFSEDIEEIRQQLTIETSKEKKLIELMEVDIDDKKVKKKVYQEEKKIGSVDFITYWKYIKFGGGIVIFSLIMCIYLAAQFTDSYSSKLLSKWVDYQQEAFDIGAGNNITSKTNETLTYDDAVKRKDWTFNLFSILIFGSAIFSLIKAYSILRFCRRASVKIHEIMCQCVIGSLMTFMDNHFIGNILNRFSYDLDVIDELYPFIFMEFFRSFISIGGMLILIATISWIFLLFALGFFVALYILRMVYMPTGRSLKRLEAMTRSPLVGHLNASVEGLTTIRAYKAEEVLKIEFDKHQDLANSTYYMVMTTSRAFGYIMDFAGAMFVVFIIAMLLFAETHISVGDVGLALTQVMMLTAYLQWAVKQWADLENCMTSVERVLEYTEVQQEDMSGGAVNDWPRDGCIKYENVSLSYNSDNRILKDISFTVKPQEKIGICGRTGAGKSSIISTLFRLYKYEGKILIDDLDTSSVSVNFLRKSISIIPQDPIIFEGSIRENVDPYQIYTDQEIWLALEKVKVKDLIPSLDEDITNLSLSSGQKQLLSLARAVIRKNKIVVLDEATANMDEESDELVHKLIRENFSNCTVIMIAHRLSTILDCDRVMVLDKGEIVEFDDPRVLLADKGSLFYSMKNQANAS